MAAASMFCTTPPAQKSTLAPNVLPGLCASIVVAVLTEDRGLAERHPLLLDTRLDEPSRAGVISASGQRGIIELLPAVAAEDIQARRSLCMIVPRRAEPLALEVVVAPPHFVATGSVLSP